MNQSFLSVQHEESSMSNDGCWPIVLNEKLDVLGLILQRCLQASKQPLLTSVLSKLPAHFPTGCL